MAEIQTVQSGAAAPGRTIINANFTALNTELGQKETPAGAQDKADAVAAYPRTKGGTYYAVDYGTISATEPVSHLAIQAAIDAAFAAGGGTVVLPPQLCLLGASLVPRSGVSLVGVMPQAPTLLPWDIGFSLSGGTILSFPGGTIFQQDTSSSFATHTGLTNFSLNSIGFDGFAKIISSGAQSKHGLLGGTFENLIAVNGTGIALEIINPQHFTIRKVTLRLVRYGVFFGSNYRIGEVDCAPGNCVVDELYIETDNQQDTTYGVMCEVMAGSEFILGAMEFRRLQVNRFKSTNKLGNHVILKGRSGYPIASMAFSSLDLEGCADAVVDISYVDRCDVAICAISPSAEWNAAVRVANSTGLLIVSAQRDTRVELMDGTSAGSTVGYGIFQDNGVSADKKLRGCYCTNSGSVWQFDLYADAKITGSGYNMAFGNGTKIDLTSASGIKVGTWDYSDTGGALWVNYCSGTINLTSTSNQTKALPAASGNAGETVTIRKTGATGTSTITGARAGDITINNQWSSVTLRSIKDPSASTYQWEIIARNGT